ncbi:hypothetical protein ACFL1X_14490 [Candidatus Hydrogenedentota bacterium]
MTAGAKRTNARKIELFRNLFSGLTNVYGTYDPVSGRSWQVKAPVTDEVVYRHLKGIRPHGVYLLMKNRTRAVVADFDNDDAVPAIEFVGAAKHYKVPAYVEKSKSKGHHVWIFFGGQSVLATKARLVMRHVLEEIGMGGTEIFPKQDVIDERISSGNFINAPLCGLWVPKDRTVFVEPTGSLKPYPNQWDFLETIQQVPESLLNEIIEINQLTQTPASAITSVEHGTKTFGLPPCTRRMLSEGVTANQRVICFRIAVSFKTAGLPYDIAVVALKEWSVKNRPTNGKRIITEREIVAQTVSAFNKEYRGCGCEEPAIIPYCDEKCPLHKKRHESLSCGETQTGKEKIQE